MENNLDQFLQTLKNNKLRVTQSRIAVATVLFKNSNQALTPEEIFQKIDASKKLHCDQVSVYRILATLEELSLVTKSKFQGEASRYMVNLCKDKEDNHHEHYFKCYSCNLVEPFKGCLVSKKEKELEKAGYTELKHHLEITGLCPSCTLS
tara:strand:+ start:330 stop:779 length:450 start_codon:yes stop_codon:yes gene_type:complete